MSDLADLIKRLEEAAEGSRELDEAIAAFIAGATLEIQPDARRAFHRDGFWVSIGQVHRYTTSIDAAALAAPLGFIWDVTSTGTAWVMDANVVPCGEQWFGKAPTPALALCIAALKARHV